MKDPSGLQTYLVQNGLVSEDEFFQAQDYALTRNMSLEEALLFLEFVDYDKLGQYLAAVFEKPYIPLLKRAPSEATKSSVSLKSAERLKIFPVKYDARSRKLLLAVADPTDPQLTEGLKSTLPHVATVSFSVASASEIAQAIDVFYKGKQLKSEPVLEIPEDFSILPNQQLAASALTLDDKVRRSERIMLLEADQPRARAIKALLQTEGYDHVAWAISPDDVANCFEDNAPDLLVVNSETFRPEGSWLTELRSKIQLPPISYYEVRPFLLGQEYSYRQMSDALVNAIAYLVRKDLQSDPGKLKETVERVKHCRLVALRMRLARSVVDGVTFAAWLSGEQIGDDFVKQATTPYRLHEILWPDRHDKQTRVEATILETVKRYQVFVKQYPDAGGDVTRIREILKHEIELPGAIAVIETLLRIIKEEEFLDGVDRRASARVLVVDPQAAEGSPIFLRLSNEGFEIQIAKTAQDGIKTISNSPVDLIISEVALGDTSGLKLCKAVKRKNETGKIPFLFLTADKGERLQAECLEAGADDFLEKPVDVEVLALKVQRLLSQRQSAQEPSGVHGSLTEMNSSDLIQSLSAGEKNVEIRLASRDRHGVIYMQAGEIIHAQTDGLNGDEAFYSLVAWQEGNFHIVSCDQFPDRTIHSPLMSMLIEGARRVDEASAE